MAQKEKNRPIRYRLVSTIVQLSAFIILGSSLILLFIPFGDSLREGLKPLPQIASSPAGTLDKDWDRVENGIHLRTGLVVAEGFDIVRGTCTSCHSAKLITQNRANYEGWKDMIQWMQQTQGLWELGKNEERILNYLAKNYAPEAIGRRQNLEATEWYVLSE